MRSILCVLLFAASAFAQLEKLAVPTQAGFRGLSVVGEKIVWASGTDGTVIRTIDGGKNWTVMTVAGAEKLDFRGIKAFDANTAVIISSGPAEMGQAQIYRTTDGGKSWKQVFEENRAGIFFDAVAFWDAKHGIVLSDPLKEDGKFALFTTDDSGLTWKQLPPAALPAALPNEGAFAASNSCLVVQGEKNAWFATGGASVVRVFRSADRGKTWQVSETPMHPANASSGIFSLAFANQNEGIAVGGDYQKPEGSDLPNMLRTSDGGKTWQAGEPTTPAGIYFSSVALSPYSAKAFFYAGGTNGLFVFARGWVKASDQNLNVVAFGGGRMAPIWIVGPKGTVGRVQLGVSDHHK